MNKYLLNFLWFGSCILLGWILGTVVLFSLRPPTPEPVVEVQVIEVRQTVSHLIKERVNFTNYYVSDPYATGTVTSSGLTTDDFSINRYGWYTWQDKVVIATATELCLGVTTGPCGAFNERKDTHHYFRLFDVVTIVVDSEEHQAIVLDSCGACNWDENLQRIDIFIADKDYAFGEMKGAVIY